MLNLIKILKNLEKKAEKLIERNWFVDKWLGFLV